MKGKGQTALGEAKDAIADALDAAATKAKEVAKNAKDAVHRLPNKSSAREPPSPYEGGSPCGA